MPQFKVYHDCLRGPTCQVKEAKSIGDARRRFTRDIFSVCVLDWDVGSPDRDVLFVSECGQLAVELDTQAENLVICNGEQRLTLPANMGHALADALNNTAVWCQRLARSYREGQAYQVAVAEVSS